MTLHYSFFFSFFKNQNIYGKFKYGFKHKLVKMLKTTRVLRKNISIVSILPKHKNYKNTHTHISGLGIGQTFLWQLRTDGQTKKQSTTVPDSGTGHPLIFRTGRKKTKKKKRKKCLESPESGLRIISDLYFAVRQSYFILRYGNNVSKCQGSDYRQGKS